MSGLPRGMLQLGMDINWYPGHMKKTRELIAANLRLVGAVVEVCDARIPVSSRNPIIDDLVGAKPRMLVLNKADLADPAATKEWLASFRSAVAMNSTTGDGLKKLLAGLDRIAAARTGNAATAPLRVMVVGVPNSGKSSLINRLTRRRAAQTGDRPGVTRGKQWLTLENGMQLLDTPGILWPKFEDPRVGLNLAFCGSIRDEIMDVPDLALELIRALSELYPDALAERYGISVDQRVIPDSDTESNPEPAPAIAAFDVIARARGCILPGRRIDYERAGRMILDEFRAGKLGRITLERPL
jgi:ribosome biogenesis GTPase A